MGTPYWFSINQEGRSTGGAFLITKKHALTASHCLPKLFIAASESTEPSKVRLLSENGTELLAAVSETSGDLALLEIYAFRTHDIIVPQTTVAEKDSLWEAPYRPSLQHPTLTGAIGNPDLPFRCADGSFISVIQLTVSEGIGDHSGYSGGPVVSKASDVAPASLLGVLIEQFPDQADSTRAANVLFAAHVADAMKRFVAFEPPIQLGIPAYVPNQASLASPPINAVSDIDVRLDEADKIIKRAWQWAQEKYISDREYKEMKARARDLVFVERSTGR